ncbi:hypothetical protein PG997_002601 [Apiospora hydei]|uniref:Ankyrin repeat protein n=1 Tax=Apiospora hydei TaxID=1337664 RepID=A0ABR1WWU1_9PEZI
MSSPCYTWRCNCVGPEDPDGKFYSIINRDDAAAFEEYLHASHCFVHNRTLPYVHAYCRDDGTPWEVAVRHGSVRVFEALLKYEDHRDGDQREWCDPSEPTPWYRYLLHRAIEQGQLEVLRFLISRPAVDIHQQDHGGGGWTPILTACRRLSDGIRGDVAREAWVERSGEIIELLLAAGVNARDLICCPEDEVHLQQGGTKAERQEGA